MISIFFYAFLTIFILFFLGYGLTLIVIPKEIRPYSLWLSPWFAIVFLVFFLVTASLIGLSVRQVSPYLVIFLIGLNLFIFLKTKLRHIFNLKEDLIITVILILSLIFNLSPLIKNDKILTTISLGNTDAVAYANAADYLINHALFEGFLHRSPNMVLGLFYDDYRWGSPIISAFFLNLLNLQGYQYTYLFQVILFLLMAPLVYILIKILYKPTLFGLILGLVMTLFNVNLLYMLYHNFLGLVFFLGIFVLLTIFLFKYLTLNKEDNKKLTVYDLIIGLIISVIYLSYHEPTFLIIFPLGLYFILTLIFNKSFFTILLQYFRISLIVILTSSIAVLHNIVFILDLFSKIQKPNSVIGWQLFRLNVPYANPFEILGFYSIHSFEPLSVKVAIILSIIVVSFILYGIFKSKNKFLIISILSAFSFLYFFTVFVKYNFFEYNRIVTYTLFFLVILFAIGITSLLEKRNNLKFFILIFFIVPILYSALKLNVRFIREYRIVDESLISLTEISKQKISGLLYIDNNIDSNVSNNWRLAWTSYFIYDRNLDFSPTLGKFLKNQFMNKVPDNGLILISKPKPGLNPPKVLLKNITWENEYYKLGRLCNSNECLMGRSEDLSSVTIGKSDYEDSLLINGWSVKEPDSRWAFGRESTLRLVNKKPVTRLAIEALTLKEPQEISVYIDDKFIGKQNIKTNWQEYSYALQEPLSQGVHNVLLKYSNIYRPIDLGISPDARELSVDIKSIKFE